ncbi:C1 family peptidase [Maribacter chungangensis]|uniref:C1 family peptidase n=1 Tax=Maribacter chungangensis TaxID=1069117 RepID=A0ABW3AZU2_9FLAO
MELRVTLLLFISTFVFARAQQSTGLLFDDDAYGKTPLKAKNVAFQDVVTEFSSASLKQFVPKVGDQEGYSTCVGWASAYYARTILEARVTNNLNTNSITEGTFSPVFTYLNSNVENDYNCQQGAFIGRAMETMVEKGVPYYKDFNVMCETKIPENLYEQAEQFKIKDFARIFGSDEEIDFKVDGVKRSLLNGNPVVIGFMVDNSFHSAKNVYVPDELGSTGGHAMCVIGFDDDKYGGSFEIVNSWGEGWGNEGYIWIKYADFAKQTRYAFEMIPMQSKPLEKKVLAGEVDFVLRNNSPMKVFNAEGEYSGSVFSAQEVVIEEEESIGDYVTEESYPIDTRYRMVTKVNQPAYVYVFGMDSDNEFSPLFPLADSISPFINSSKSEVILPPAPPGKRAYARLSKDVDKEYTIVVFSMEKLDLGKIGEQLTQMEGTLLDKLYVIFEDELIPKDTMTMGKDKMSFSAEFDQGSLALMILDIKRS